MKCLFCKLGTLIVTYFLMTMQLINGQEGDPSPSSITPPGGRKIKKASVITLSPEQKYNEMVYRLKHLTTHWYERYSPFYGYEPYWVDGDWVYIKDSLLVTTSPGETTTQIVDVCGDECDYMYRRYGKTCAVKIGLHYYYYENDKHFHTFPSYCSMLAYNCDKMDRIDERYAFVHIGQCEKDKNLYRYEHAFYDWTGNDYMKDFVAPRHHRFLDELKQRFSGYNLTFPFDLPTTIPVPT